MTGNPSSDRCVICESGRTHRGRALCVDCSGEYVTFAKRTMSGKLAAHTTLATMTDARLGARLKAHRSTGVLHEQKAA